MFTEKLALQGYDMTSVSEIASALGLSKGTVMHHFGSKDRMLQELSLEYMRRRLAELEVIEESLPSPEDRLAAIILALVTAFRDDQAATVAFSREFTRFVNDPVMDEVRVLRRRYTDMVRGVLEDGMASGVFREADPTIVTLQIIGMCNWSWTWLDPEGRLSVDEIAEIYVRVVLCGMLTDGDREVLSRLPEPVARLRAARTE